MKDRHDDESLPADEAALLGSLGAALGADPPPAGMPQRLEGLLLFRDVDRELLELLEGAAAEPAGMRGAVGAREGLTFELGNGAVAVELVPERDELRGQVLAGDVAVVVLERLRGEPQVSAVDGLGRFSFPLLHPGPVRLRLQVADTRRLTTDWFLL